MLTDPLLADDSSGLGVRGTSTPSRANRCDYATVESGTQFVRAFQHAEVSDHPVWLATDMRQASLEGINLAAWFGPLNTLLDNQKDSTSALAT